MKLVIITVCFNDLSGLKKTLESVRRYNEQISMHIVVDGRFDGETEVFLVNKQLSYSKLKYISEPDKGIFDAMNKGMEIVKKNMPSQGDYYIWFLNSGDVAGDFDFESITSNKPLVFFCSKQVSPMVPEHSTIRPYFKGEGNNFSKWLSYNAPVHQAVLFSSAIIPEINYDLNFRNQADTKLIFELSRKYQYDFFNVIICVFELGGDSSNYGNYNKVIGKLSEDLFIKNLLKKRSFLFFYLQTCIFHLKYILTLLLGKKNFHKFHLQVLRAKYYFQSIYYSR